MSAAIHLKSQDIDRRLDSFGITVNMLREAVKFGQLHRSACTENDPPCIPGILAWARTMRGLREILAPLGWVKSDENNLSVVLNQEGSIAIAVATGDEGTGVPGLTSRTKYPKGPATAAAIEQNAVQLALFEFEEKVIPIVRKSSDCMTWVLLVSRSRNEIRCELSLPSYIADDGRVDKWAERIILPPLLLDAETNITVLPDDIDEEIVVEITRRDQKK